MKTPAKTSSINNENSLKTVKKSFLLELLITVVIFVWVALLIFFLTNSNVTTPQIVKDGEEQISQQSLPETGSTREIYEVASYIPESEDTSRTEQVESDGPLYGLLIDADVTLPELDSFARITLVDDTGDEYLVYESYLLLAGESTFSVTDTCEETCRLDGVMVSELKIETKNNATIDITKTNEVTDEAEAISEDEENTRREALLDQKVEKLNAEITRNNLHWTAGKTSFARLSYAEKNEMYEGAVPSFQGFDYYIGGVFETIADSYSRIAGISLSKFAYLHSEFIMDISVFMIKELSLNKEFGYFENSLELGDVKSGTLDSLYVDSWDWRDMHGADSAGSYYFDGNPDSQENGNGWATSVKDQRSCGSCWAFAVTGATEALANIYYNQHYDLDLAEQDALSCSGAGSCGGGWPSVTLDYYTSTGVVDEACFPYTATDQSCSNRCSNPAERVKISGRVDFTNKTEDNLKGMIVDYGPMSGGIYSWSHAMVLLGWHTDQYGSTYWTFKNSWGVNWGDSGYGYVKTSITNIGWTHALINPVTSTQSRPIRCVDADGDGYYNWGISANKPASCPGGIPDEKDCDDSNPSLVSYSENYSCIALLYDTYANPGSHSFNGVLVNQTSQAREILIRNMGEDAIQVSNILIENTDNFSLNLNPAESDTPCGQVDPLITAGESCSIEVTFSPVSESTYNTNIVISSNDPENPSFNVLVSGFGTRDPETVCSFFNGYWIDEEDKCFKISNTECTDYNGSINICDSYCPYDYGLGCVLNCTDSCEF
jgi:hypothetical protein